MGANFRGQNSLGLILPDDVLVQVGLKFVWFHVEPYVLDPTRFLFTLDGFVSMLRGHHR